jgi:hypothetical protein
MESRFKNILIYIAIFVSSITLFKEPFEGYIHYFIFILLLPGFISRFGLARPITMILLVMFIVGFLQIMIGNNTWALFMKIFLGMFLSISFFYGVVQYFKLDMDRLFRFYLKGAVWVSWIGLIQYISYRVGFGPGFNYNWLLNKWAYIASESGSLRVNSIFSEASQCAIVLGPAAFVSLLNLLPGTQRYGLTRIQSILILLITVLTTSSTGYIGLFFSIFLIMLNYGRIIYFVAGLAVLIPGSILLYNYVPDFRTRIDTSVGLWIDGEFTTENVNSSSFVLYNNFHIASENFKSNFITGTGLGSHPIAFEKYTLTHNEDILDITFNNADGNSLLIRIISEGGLIGIIFIFYFLFRFKTRRSINDEDEPGWIISNAVLVLILLYLVRQGNYFLNALPLFFWMYYYTHKNEEYRRLNPEEEEGETEEEEEETEETDEAENTHPVY